MKLHETLLKNHEKCHEKNSEKSAKIRKNITKKSREKHAMQSIKKAKKLVGTPAVI